MNAPDEFRPRLDVIIHDKAFNTKRAEQDSSTYHHRVSNAGSCPRALVYQALGTPAAPHSGRTAIIFDDGNVHEDATVRWLSETGFPVSERQLGLDIFEIPNSSIPNWHCDTCARDIPGGMIHGHIDGMILDENRSYLFEHKSTNSRAFARLDDELPLGYISQCCCYIYGLNKIGLQVTEALLVCKNKDNGEYKQLYIAYDIDSDYCSVTREWNGITEFVENPVKKVIELHELVDACMSFEGNLPKRPYTMDDWHCGFCRYKDTCWQGYAEEVRSMSTEQIIPQTDELSVRIARVACLKSEKKKIESELKEIRAEILRALDERGIRSGFAGEISFGIRVSKRSYVDKKLLPEETKLAATRSFVIQSLSVGGDDSD